MKYDNPKLRQILAAEYVLGTLRGRARHRFERLARGETAVRSEIRFWESRLAGLAADLEPKSPPPSVWFAAAAQDRQRTRRGSRRSAARCRRRCRPRTCRRPPRRGASWAGLATAAGVVLAVLIGTRVPLPGEPGSGPVAVTAPPQAVSPVPAPGTGADLRVPAAAAGIRHAVDAGREAGSG